MHKLLENQSNEVWPVPLVANRDGVQGSTRCQRDPFAGGFIQGGQDQLQKLMVELAVLTIVFLSMESPQTIT